VFDTVGWLRGGLGNVIYFFLFAFVPVLAVESESIPAALEPLGLKLFSAEMGAAARQAFPNYTGGFSLGSTDRVVIGTFYWPGVTWTAEIVAWRLVIVLAAVAVGLLAAALFDRFDTSRARQPRSRGTAAPGDDALPELLLAPLPVRHVTLAPVRPGFSFWTVLIAELKLMLKGQRWWWFGGAVVLALVGLFNDVKTVREVVLMLTWIWPALIWSGIGTREARYGTAQMVFSAASPLTRQLPATWLAGVLVAVLAGSGAGARLLLGGDGQAVAMWLAAVMFIPSLALACGVWSGTSKLFEVLYVVIWYLGPLNRVPALDYVGVTAAAQPGVWLGAGALLLAVATVGRWRQLRA
jgi:hypothetical protein